jgi:hypothetical protein
MINQIANGTQVNNLLKMGLMKNAFRKNKRATPRWRETLASPLIAATLIQAEGDLHHSGVQRTTYDSLSELYVGIH